MKEIITVRILTNLGYVCHGQVWESLDELVRNKRTYYPGCTFNIKDADEATAAYWRNHAEKNTVKKAA